jgi:FkbM family methyltransferase
MITKRRIERFVSKFYDPLVNLKIGNQTIKVNLSHLLIDAVKNYPDYNFNLPRIIKYVSDKIPNIKVIDIGANVGDTVAFIKNYTDPPILCIDGEEQYLKLLRSNVAQYNNITVCHALVGEENAELNVSMKVERGTAFVEKGDQKTKVRTLENIVEQYPDFKDSKVLKVDTDGYDTLILRGSAGFLKKNKPIIFLEFDPCLISRNNDNPFNFPDFLENCGYKYLMFYVNNGDYLCSCEIGQKNLINELIHYFSGRNINVFTDICAFPSEDKSLFDLCVSEEIKHFKKARNY